MKTSGEVRARQAVAMNFEVLDADKQSRAATIWILSPLTLRVLIVDEEVTTVLLPDFTNPENLEFSVRFPKPGKYKVWLTFMYRELTQMAFVVDVK